MSVIYFLTEHQVILMADPDELRILYHSPKLLTGVSALVVEQLNAI